MGPVSHCDVLRPIPALMIPAVMGEGGGGGLVPSKGTRT